MRELGVHINNLYYPNGLQWTAARHSSISLLLVTATKPEISIQDCKIIVVYIGIYLLFCSVFSSFDDDEGYGMTKYH